MQSEGELFQQFKMKYATQGFLSPFIKYVESCGEGKKRKEAGKCLMKENIYAKPSYHVASKLPNFLLLLLLLLMTNATYKVDEGTEELKE
jgi:hypothetical protein